jgi:hypothetical protein
MKKISTTFTMFSDTLFIQLVVIAVKSKKLF